MKPCPFYHEAHELKHAYNGEVKYCKSDRAYYVEYYVECSWCGARGPIAEDKEKAIQWWNERSEG